MKIIPGDAGQKVQKQEINNRGKADMGNCAEGRRGEGNPQSVPKGVGTSYSGQNAKNGL